MPSKVFSKGDSMSELPQKTSMGGGGGSDVMPISRSGSVGRDIPPPYPSVSRNPPPPSTEYREALARAYLKSQEAAARDIRSSGRPKIDKPMGAAAIGMGAAAGAGVVAKKRKDAEKMEAYKRKPRMADKAPKVNLRKAYQE